MDLKTEIVKRRLKQMDKELGRILFGDPYIVFTTIDGVEDKNSRKEFNAKSPQAAKRKASSMFPNVEYARWQDGTVFDNDKAFKGWNKRDYTSKIATRTIHLRCADIDGTVGQQTEIKEYWWEVYEGFFDKKVVRSGVVRSYSELQAKQSATKESATKSYNGKWHWHEKRQLWFKMWAEVGGRHKMDTFTKYEHIRLIPC